MGIEEYRESYVDVGCGSMYVGRRVLDVKCGCECGWPGKIDKARQDTDTIQIQYTWGHYIYSVQRKYRQ